LRSYVKAHDEFTRLFDAELQEEARRKAAAL
jgi:hypothetical protein